MSTFLLIPGAGGAAWYWHRVTPLLEQAGHRAIAVELPGDDPSAGLSKYAALIVDAAEGNERDIVLVAQSMGGFTAPLVAERIAIQRLVMVNAMIPTPGETASAWGKNTGSQAARAAAARRGGYAVEFDLSTYFLHDVPPDVAEMILSHERDEAPIAFEEPCAFTAWPDVPLHMIAGRDDRLFPAEFVCPPNSNACINCGEWLARSLRMTNGRARRQSSRQTRAHALAETLVSTLPRRRNCEHGALRARAFRGRERPGRRLVPRIGLR